MVLVHKRKRKKKKKNVEKCPHLYIRALNPRDIMHTVNNSQKAFLRKYTREGINTPFYLIFPFFDVRVH